MVRSWRKRLAAAFLAVGFVNMGLGVFATGATAAAGSIDFIAAGPGTYDHSDPGDPTATFSYNGRNINKNEGVVEALLGADFRCADKVVFFAAIPYTETNNGDISLAFEFSTETTGHKANTPKVGFASGVADFSANIGDDAHTSAGGTVSTPTFATGNKTFTATVGVTGISPASTFILRITTHIYCEPDAVSSDQNGNLQASMDPLLPAKGGAQTINLRSPGDLVVPTAALTIAKTSVNATGTFTFDVDCTDDTYDSGTNDFQVTTSVDGVQATTGAGNYPVGMSCRVTELDPGAGWTVDPAVGYVDVTIASGGSTASFTNTASSSGPPADGTLQVTKSVNDTANDNFDASQLSFPFDVLCTKQGATNLTFSGSASPTTPWTQTVQSGYACTVTEDTSSMPSAGAGTWGTPGYGNNGAVIPANGTATITITNTRSVSSGGSPIVTGPSFGTLTVSKVVQNGAGGEQFRFAAVCGTDRDEFVLADGQSTTLFDIPVGTTCSVTEELPAATETTSWTNVVADSSGVGDGVVLVDGAETVTFTNIRTAVQGQVVDTTTTTTTTTAPAVTTPAPAIGGVELPRTGAETRMILFYAGIALVLGGLLLGWAERGERVAPARVRRR